MKLVKAIGGLRAMVLTISAAACNGGTRNEEKSELPLTSAYGIGDQDFLYGMCYLLEERDYDGDYDMAAEVEVMKNLGVKTVRQWMHFTNLMTDKETLKEDECEEMHELLRLCSEAGMVNIGMNHHNFNGGTNSTGKPYERDIGNADYVAWLDDYYTSWYTLASEFPEVKYWEIDNEVNNPDFHARDLRREGLYRTGNGGYRRRYVLLRFPRNSRRQPVRDDDHGQYDRTAGAGQRQPAGILPNALR